MVDWLLTAVKSDYLLRFLQVFFEFFTVNFRKGKKKKEFKLITKYHLKLRIHFHFSLWYEYTTRMSVFAEIEHINFKILLLNLNVLLYLL